MIQITHLGRHAENNTQNWLPTIAPSVIRENYIDPSHAKWTAMISTGLSDLSVKLLEVQKLVVWTVGNHG